MFDIFFFDVNRISKFINVFVNYLFIEEEFEKNLIFNKEVLLLKNYEKFINYVLKL